MCSAIGNNPNCIIDAVKEREKGLLLRKYSEVGKRWWNSVHRLKEWFLTGA